MIKYTYKNNIFYFNLFKDIYFQDITKKIDSDWFYVAKDFMKQTKLNNSVNTFNFSFDCLVYKQKKEELKSIFKENFGKFGKFWVEIPSTLEIEENATIGSNFIIVKNSYNFLSTSNFNRYLVVKKNNQDSNIINNTLINIQLLKITNIANNYDGTESIYFDLNLNFDLIKEDCIINNLFLCRFDTDTLNIDKVDNNLYKLNLNFKELQQETI